MVPRTRITASFDHLVYIIGQGLFIPIGLTFLQFAYTFRGNPYRRESRVFLAVTGLAMTGVPVSADDDGDVPPPAADGKRTTDRTDHRLGRPTSRFP